MKKYLLLAVVALLALTANAYDFEVDGIYYNITGNEATVTYREYTYTSNYFYSGSVVIPQTVTYNNVTYPVTAIGSSAFCGCTGLTEITIPNSITAIRSEAFRDCVGLSSVVIPKSVVSIGENAFFYCNNLSDVTLYNSVASLGKYCFFTQSIKKLTLLGIGEWKIPCHSTYYTGLHYLLDTLVVGAAITGISFSYEPGVYSPYGINSSQVYSYASSPPVCDETTFRGYDATLHVLPSSVVNYITADYWQNFSSFSNDINERVVLNQKDASLIQWETLQLEGNVEPSGTKLLWSSTNPKVATVDENGNVTAISGGECYIYAEMASNLAACDVCHIIVNYPEISLELDRDSIEFNVVGDQVTLTASITPDNTGLGLAWSSSDLSVATVENGIVTAIGIGECDITATVLDKSVVCHVTVNSTITISFDSDEVSIKPNEIQTLMLTFDPTETDVKVTVNDPTIAFARILKSNAAGNNSYSVPILGAQQVQLIGIKEGTTMVTVESTDGKAIPATCLVTVYTEPGDVNCDGFVNISDVTDLIDYLLGSDVTNFKAGNADLDDDGSVNIADVTTLIDFLLSNGN